MTMAGLPLVEHLPAPDGSAIVLLGGEDTLARALRRAGYRVDRHALDTGPLAPLSEQRCTSTFVPPVVTWPYPDASHDAVILLDELALTVLEEEALSEAARVLRPGGVLLLRVPAAGRLAWLDGYNAFRYVREITHRGRRLSDSAMRASGIGLSDCARLALFLIWRWALRSRRGDVAIRRVPETLARLEGRLAPAGRGYWLVAAAERLPAV
jgi:SAM-dependent methyltransferase